jgi:hypothetical protein
LKKLVYVSGPYTAATVERTLEHIKQAEIAGDAIRSGGSYALVVHSEGLPYAKGELDDTHGAQYWYEETLEKMRRCDAVVMLPGWQQSIGCLNEYAEAKRLGIPVYESIGAWLNGGGR